MKLKKSMQASDNVKWLLAVEEEHSKMKKYKTNDLDLFTDNFDGPTFMKYYE